MAASARYNTHMPNKRDNEKIAEAENELISRTGLKDPYQQPGRRTNSFWVPDSQRGKPVRIHELVTGLKNTNPITYILILGFSILVAYGLVSGVAPRILVSVLAFGLFSLGASYRKIKDA